MLIPSQIVVDRWLACLDDHYNMLVQLSGMPSMSNSKTQALPLRPVLVIGHSLDLAVRAFEVQHTAPLHILPYTITWFFAFYLRYVTGVYIILGTA